MSREYPILYSPPQLCAGNKPACGCPGQTHVQASVLALRQGPQWDSGLLSAFPTGFRAELEQGWEGGETALSRLHTAGSCREHGCSVTLPDWQGLRNLSTGTQVGPGLPTAAPSPSELCPAWLCAPKSWCSSSVHVPSVLQCWQHSGVGHWEGTMGGACRMFPVLSP